MSDINHCIIMCTIAHVRKQRDKIKADYQCTMDFLQVSSLSGEEHAWIPCLEMSNCVSPSLPGKQ